MVPIAIGLNINWVAIGDSVPAVEYRHQGLKTAGLDRNSSETAFGHEYFHEMLLQKSKLFTVIPGTNLLHGYHG